jgi:hypothetical protein
MSVTASPSLPPALRRHPRRALGVAALLLAALLVPLGLSGTATAATSSEADAASTWMAAQVGSDGAVTNPYGGGASVDWTVNVALGLTTTGNEPDALARAMAYIEANAESYVTDPTANTTGRYGWLMILSRALDLDPHAFGDADIDLVAGLMAQYEQDEPGLFGPINTFGSVFNQSLAILGLVAAGETPPAAAVTWLQDQQCDAPASSAGGWQPYRAPSGGGLDPCGESVGFPSFTGADANSTAFAVQALDAVGVGGPAADALTWLHQLQVSSGSAVGGFGQYVGDPADPNSTAVAIQAIVAAGEDPTGSGWTTGGGTPLSSLQSWIIASGADAGALSSPFSAGFSDLFATFQGVWGLALQPFPLPAAPAPPTTSTSTSTTTTTPSTGTAGTGAAQAVSANPNFTG